MSVDTQDDLETRQAALTVTMNVGPGASLSDIAAHLGGLEELILRAADTAPSDAESARLVVARYWPAAASLPDFFRGDVNVVRYSKLYIASDHWDSLDDFAESPTAHENLDVAPGVVRATYENPLEVVLASLTASVGLVAAVADALAKLIRLARSIDKFQRILVDDYRDPDLLAKARMAIDNLVPRRRRGVKDRAYTNALRTSSSCVSVALSVTGLRVEISSKSSYEVYEYPELGRED